MLEQAVQLINEYGFPVVAALGLGYMVYAVWRWSTQEVRPVIDHTNTVLIALIDRVRMLDNDLIRLNEKVEVALELTRRLQREPAKTDNKEKS